MVNDFLKWLVRFMFFGTVWVFILSITISGRPVFSYAHDVLVDNPVVEYIDEQLADLWSKISETARISFKEVGVEDNKG